MINKKCLYKIFTVCSLILVVGTFSACGKKEEEEQEATQNIERSIPCNGTRVSPDSLKITPPDENSPNRVGLADIPEGTYKISEIQTYAVRKATYVKDNEELHAMRHVLLNPGTMSENDIIEYAFFDTTGLYSINFPVYLPLTISIDNHLITFDQNLSYLQTTGIGAHQISDNQWLQCYRNTGREQTLKEHSALVFPISTSFNWDNWDNLVHVVLKFFNPITTAGFVRESGNDRRFIVEYKDNQLSFVYFQYYKSKDHAYPSAFRLKYKHEPYTPDRIKPVPVFDKTNPTQAPIRYSDMKYVTDHS